MRKTRKPLRHLKKFFAEVDAIAAKAAAGKMVLVLSRIRGVGRNFATVLTREEFYRKFDKRRQLASYVGIAPTPHQSGAMDRDRRIARAGNPRGAHVVVLPDQAGWHQAKDLVIPTNITLLPLPPRSPELNPLENIWQYMRENWLSNRVFSSYRNILDHCAAAWKQLADQPWTIMAIGTREWTHR